ncbi:MAG: regulatory protein RecX [Methylococcales bacterium]
MNLNEIRDICLRLLSRREHSRRELTYKLLQRGHQENEIEWVVDALAEQGLQSERRFTEQYVLNRVEKGYGSRRISHELKEKGIDRLLFEEVVRTENIDWADALEKVYRRKYREILPKSLEERQKRWRFLFQQRGFSSEQIEAVFDSRFNLSNKAPTDD